jgi:AraC-like DNA-binding protein
MRTTNASGIHRVEQHRSNVPGIEAISRVSNHVFPRHAHDQFGIGVITFGGQRAWSGIGHVDACAGDVIMVNPGEIHDGAPHGDVRGWRMLYLDPTIVASALDDEGAGEFEIMRPVAGDPILATLWARLFASLTAEHSESLAIEESLLRSLIQIARRHATHPPTFSGRLPCVAKALERLDSAPAAPVSLAELAALSGVSRFQLLRGFARQVGTTPHAYLVQRRVRVARQLIAGGHSIAEAAAQAGFADQSHLTRTFFRQFGITPSRYRTAIIDTA